MGGLTVPAVLAVEQREATPERVSHTAILEDECGPRVSTAGDEHHRLRVWRIRRRIAVAVVAAAAEVWWSEHAPYDRHFGCMHKVPMCVRPFGGAAALPRFDEYSVFIFSTDNFYIAI